MVHPVHADELRIVPANHATGQDLEAIFGTADYPLHCQCQRFKVTGWLWRVRRYASQPLSRSAVIGPPRVPSSRRVLTDQSVHGLAEQVGVPRVPAILLDQVAEKPAQAGMSTVGSG